VKAKAHVLFISNIEVLKSFFMYQYILK